MKRQSRMFLKKFGPWIGLITVWVLLGGAALYWTQAGGALVGAAVGASVTVAIYVANRDQGHRQATLELFGEYYSSDFAVHRSAAERFMKRYRHVDWSCSDPYVVGKDDGDLAGYSAVLRYWQRVAILYEEGQLQAGLAQRLLSRELGHWSVVIVEPMKVREDMYVLTLLLELVASLSKGQGSEQFGDGQREARRSKAS